MPVAKIQAPDGRIITLEVPEGATEQQILAFVQSQDLSQFQQTPIEQPQQVAQPERGLGEQIIGGLENVASVVSGAVAEPLSGLAGIGALLPGGQTPTEAIESTRESLTFKPRTEAGQEQQQAVGEFLQPVGEALKSTEDFLGNSVLKVTGSPELAAIAHSLPTAVLQGLGVKGLKSTKLSKSKLSTNVSEAITQAAPDIQKLKSAASELYKQLDNSGVSVKPAVYDRFVSKLTSKLAKENIDPVLHPKSAQVLKILNDKSGTPKTFSELNNMRQIVGEAASSIDPADARLGKIMLNTLDDGIEQLATAEGGKFKSARAIWRKTKKSQDINDMIANATQQASGLENGLRIGARQILKSKKKSRGFTKSELAALRQVSEGTTTANIAKFLGKFGISEGQATSMLGASIGIGGGGALGAAFGGSLGAGLGAVAVPLFGQIAKKTAQRITLNSTKFADELVRAGSNAKDIVKVYFRNTPVNKRTVSDLTDLLIDPNVDLSKITRIPAGHKMLDDAIFFAREIKRKAKRGASVGAIAAPGVIPNEGGRTQ